MTPDPAAFRDEDVLAVYGPRPACFQTGKPATTGMPVDQHHVQGRGGRDPDSRRVHSSILNLAILKRDIHHGPMRDKPHQREAYLDEAIRHVFTAVGSGAYQLRDEDRAFLRLYHPGMLEGC